LKKKIDLIIRILLIITSIGLLCFGFTYRYFTDESIYYNYLIILSFFLIGFGQIGAFTLSFVSIAAIGSPIDESITTGFPNYLSEFVGIAA